MLYKKTIAIRTSKDKLISISLFKDTHKKVAFLTYAVSVLVVLPFDHMMVHKIHSREETVAQRQQFFLVMYCIIACEFKNNEKPRNVNKRFNYGFCLGKLKKRLRRQWPEKTHCSL